MKKPRNKYYLLNYIFLFCLIMLVVNDHYLKYEYGNWFTGKLSDIVGIIMLPLLLTWLFPAVKEKSIVISAALFIFWKSPLSQGAIDWYNQYTFIQTSRIADYTDMFVLLLLPIPWVLIKRIDYLHTLQINQVHPLLILFPTVISLMATCPPKKVIYTRSEGNLKCYDCHFSVHYNQPEIVEMLKKADLVLDTLVNHNSRDMRYEEYFQEENIHFYMLNSLVLDKDTIRDIEFCMQPDGRDWTKVSITRMNVRDDVSTWELTKQADRYYKSLLLKFFLPHFKN